MNLVKSLVEMLGMGELLQMTWRQVRRNGQCLAGKEFEERLAVMREGKERNRERERELSGSAQFSRGWTGTGT